jgi:hypothetical protein
MWCPICQKRNRSRFTDVSITGMYYALKRFDVCEKDEFNKLLREWKKYSKSKNIDIYGNEKTVKVLSQIMIRIRYDGTTIDIGHKADSAKSKNEYI